MKYMLILAAAEDGLPMPGLHEARRPARTDRSGVLVPLDLQDRSLWDKQLIAEGTALLDRAFAPITD